MYLRVGYLKYFKKYDSFKFKIFILYVIIFLNESFIK